MRVTDAAFRLIENIQHTIWYFSKVYLGIFTRMTDHQY